MKFTFIYYCKDKYSDLSYFIDWYTLNTKDVSHECQSLEALHDYIVGNYPKILKYSTKSILANWKFID